MKTRLPPRKIVVSIGILARNEESRLPDTLASLFRQTLFAELERRGHRAEIWCVANACTDNTAAVAERFFHEQTLTHPQPHAFLAHAVSVATPGKINAWNLFVHEISARDTRCLILMDADIKLGHTTTLWNLYLGLERNLLADVTVGEPVKDLALKPSPTLRERLSLATSRLTRDSGPQLTGQLYAIRAEVARHIRLPRDLAACEDGFIKQLVCTDLLRRPSDPRRLMRIPAASHVFEAYTGADAILRNQKRQMIGQAFVHVLVDRFLPQACAERDEHPASAVARLDEDDPAWLRHLMADHLRSAKYFWRLFPGVCTFRIRRWALQPFGQKLRTLPATIVGTAVTLVAAHLAFSFLRRGAVAYWPDKPVHPGPRPTLPGFGLAPRATSG
jgi:hypothetical protein